jgi:hypothetical protein
VLRAVDAMLFSGRIAPVEDKEGRQGNLAPFFHVLDTSRVRCRRQRSCGGHVLEDPRARPSPRRGAFELRCTTIVAIRQSLYRHGQDRKLDLLDFDIPAQPEGLLKLSVLLGEDEVDLQAVSLLVSSDMALAAAVLKAVNSARYGLRGRVQSVQQAITYLGTREVAAVTFELGLRAVFPAAPELEPLWERASVRGLLMGRIGQALNVDAWAAHSAGLFEECGKAVMFRHASDRYRPMLDEGRERRGAADARTGRVRRQPRHARRRAVRELGRRPRRVDSVRFHVIVNSTLELPMQLAQREICALSALANALMTDPDGSARWPTRSRRRPASTPARSSERPAGPGAHRGRRRSPRGRLTVARARRRCHEGLVSASGRPVSRASDRADPRDNPVWRADSVAPPPGDLEHANPP